MSVPAAPLPTLEPLFLDTPGGARFCLFHPPPGAPRAALLYLHPFAEEMNKTRRMAALAARRLAARGVAVLQLDLHGCGDSGGEFHEARWDGWLRDVDAGLAWLERRSGLRPGLWGMRLGALLALDHAARAQAGSLPGPQRLLLWQPVSAGAQHLTQFLRLRLAGELLQDGASKGAHDQGGTAALRVRLEAGEVLEIAGYRLHPDLARALDRVDAARLAAPRCRVDWLDLVAAPGRPLAPAAQRLVDAWRTAGADVQAQALAGPSFWNTQEMTEAPALLDATEALFMEGAP